MKIGGKTILELIKWYIILLIGWMMWLKLKDYFLKCLGHPHQRDLIALAASFMVALCFIKQGKTRDETAVSVLACIMGGFAIFGIYQISMIPA